MEIEKFIIVFVLPLFSALLATSLHCFLFSYLLLISSYPASSLSFPTIYHVSAALLSTVPLTARLLSCTKNRLQNDAAMHRRETKVKSSVDAFPPPLSLHQAHIGCRPREPPEEEEPLEEVVVGGSEFLHGLYIPTSQSIIYGRRWAEGKVGPTSVSLPLPLLFFETRKKERRRSENAQFFSFRNILPPSWWRRLPRGGFEKVFPSAKRPKTGRNKGPSCFPFLLMKEKNRTGAAQMGGKKKNHTTLYCIHVLFTSLDSRAFLSSLILVFSHHE